MDFTETPVPGALVLQPKVFGDSRGFFLESYNLRAMNEIGIREPFVQDNHSFSLKNVLRGLHYQLRAPQGKLVRVVAGEIFDVIVDLRRSSPAFGRWHGVMLSGEGKQILWIPKGLAHGFLVCSESAHVLYKATDFYTPEDECCLLWNDRALGIEWPLAAEPILSPKDAQGRTLAEAQTFA